MLSKYGCLALTISVVVLLGYVAESEAWSGHYVTSVLRWRYSFDLRCVFNHYRWGCCRYHWGWRTHYYYVKHCQTGWTHSAGSQDCIIPVCRPTCKNGGQCANPNYCTCPSTATGAYSGCQTLTCSYKLPCYPGDCHDNNQCTCEAGFKSVTRQEGCISFDESVDDMHPIIGKSTATLSMVRRSDNRQNFMYSIDGTNVNVSNGNDAEIYWLNQKRFNTLEFESESIFTPDPLPERPTYVHDSKIGIVHNQITVNVSKWPRNGGVMRDQGSFKTHLCNNGAADLTPHLEVSRCTIKDDQFVTLIEHSDWMTVTYTSRNGGYRKLVDIDHGSTPYATNLFKGLTDIKQVEFRFDFIAPKHCSEPNSFDVCPANANILTVEQEFTKIAIKPRWSGWTDDLSGIWKYYMEVFLLGPDPYNRLVELSPLDPVFSETINATQGGVVSYPEYTPSDPGMYSVLLETRDLANNSRTARRLVLFDDQSEISLLTSHPLYVSSAVAETGYSWQTATAGGNTTIIVNWNNHFVNALHENKKLLNQVLPYPMQFKDIEDDGMLFAKKYVNDSLDDHEGLRTVDAIRNRHGIVRFQMAKVYTEATTEPTVWSDVTPLADTATFTETLSDGAKIRVWVKAHDMMGNTKVDSTSVHFDTSLPKVSDQNSTRTKIMLNIDTETYLSRIQFDASDDQSGVHKLDYRITVHVPNKADTLLYENSTSANMDMDVDPSTSPTCRNVLGVCFLVEQTVDISNCWFMVGKEDLANASAIIDVTVYNQAMLSQSLQFKVEHINKLAGLESYAGPTNIRTEQLSDRGFRIAWDLPEQESCYGRAEIIIILYKKDATGSSELETHFVQSTATYFDIYALNPETSYEVQFGMKLMGDQMTDGTTLKVKTAAADAGGGVGGGVIAGVAIGVLALVALMIVAFVILLRRGHMQPVRRGLRAATVKYRKTFYGGSDANDGAYMAGGPSSSTPNKAAHGLKRPVTSPFEEDLYIYGGMDFDTNAFWNLARGDVTFQTLIKSGHFANVYKSTLKGSKDTVVAKTLKEGYSDDDKLLMTAKINFTGTMVGNHPNVLKFVGAVTGDAGMGPFIIYEYCEKGPLSEYLRSQKANVTLQLKENLFRFGRDIAAGMEFLVSKGIVHRRLAARNVLLTADDEVKIAGFGPQPADPSGDGDAEAGKRERIPVKWSAPECMGSTAGASEKSDVWSYAVVLWEIFSLGDTPYSNIRGRDLPAKVKKGERLGKPDLCDDTWYGVMTKCWTLKQDKRPAFSEIRGELDELFVAAPGDDYYYYKR